MNERAHKITFDVVKLNLNDFEDIFWSKEKYQEWGK
jgi:hypothetical protein